MKTAIVVVDGLGGGLGAQIVSLLREKMGKEAEILALGTNSSATERMLKSGADRGATGENAIRVSIGFGEFILGPIGIAVPNSMLGEVSPAVAVAVTEARGERILIPVSQSHFHLVGMEGRPVGRLVEDAVNRVLERVGAGNPLAEYDAGR
ncbi:MAG: DUF3842 family protein [Treponema sp.]|nr:DUF3842 family protein [Treponema sp.]